MKRSFLCSILYSVDRSKKKVFRQKETGGVPMDYNYNGYDRGYTEPAMTSADYMNLSLIHI